MKLRVAALILVLGSLLVVLGCGGGPSQTASNSQTAQPTSLTGQFNGEFITNGQVTPNIVLVVNQTADKLSGTLFFGVIGTNCGQQTGNLSSASSVAGSSVFISVTTLNGVTLTINGQANSQQTAISGQYQMSGWCGSSSGSAVFTKQ
ncbi:MAG: hypothetical protein ABSG52_16670 [Terriglobales bacterium]|jgi:hypothetical protein